MLVAITRFRALFALLAAAAILAPPASAVEVQAPTTAVTSSIALRNPTAVRLDDGSTKLLWFEYDEDAGETHSIVATQATSGGSFVRGATDGVGSSWDDYTIASGGSVFAAAWDSSHSGDYWIEVRDAEGVETLADGAANLSGEAVPIVAVDAAGHATAAMTLSSFTTERVAIATRQVDGTWSRSFFTPGGVKERLLDYAVSANGTVAMVTADAAFDPHLYVRPAGGTWSAPYSFPLGRVHKARISVNDSGQVGILWESPSAYNYVNIQRWSGGAFGDNHKIGQTQDRMYDVVIDAAGNVTGTWDDQDYMLRARTLSADGTLGAEYAPATGRLGKSSIVVAQDGTVLLAWTHETGGEVRLATRVAGSWTLSTLQAAATDTFAGLVNATILPTGHGAITWDTSHWLGGMDYEYAIKVARIVGESGPVISATTVPTAGTAGTAVAMSASVTPSDATIAWNFGDGQSGTGSNVSHTYAAAGSYTVTITASRGGQTSTTTKPITIAAAPVPPKDTDGDGIADGSDCAPSDASKPAKGVEDGNCNGRDDRVELEEIRKEKEALKQKVAALTATITKSVPKAQPKPVPAATIQKSSSYLQPVNVTAPLVLNTQLSANLVGANVVSAGGGNLIKNANGVVSAGGLNLINTAMGVVSAGGLNLIGKDADRAAKKPKQVLLGGGGATFRKAGKGSVKTVLNKQGKAVVNAYLAKAKALKKRGKKVAPLKIRITTVAGPIEAGTAPAVYTTRVLTITG